jgi:hypothetical protein
LLRHFVRLAASRAICTAGKGTQGFDALRRSFPLAAL